MSRNDQPSGEKSFNLLDNRIFYSLTFVLCFLLYFYVTLGNLSPDQLLLFPHPLLVLFVFLGGFYMILSMQEIDHHDVRTDQIIQFLSYSMVPTYLAYRILTNLISVEKKKNNDPYFILGLRLISYILLFLSFLVILIILIAIFGENEYFILGILIIGPIGMFGYVLGWHLSRIRSNIHPFFQTIQVKLVAPVVGSKLGRSLISIILLILIFTLLILNLLRDFPVLSV